MEFLLPEIKDDILQKSKQFGFNDAPQGVTPILIQGTTDFLYVNFGLYQGQLFDSLFQDMFKKLKSHIYLFKNGERIHKQYSVDKYTLQPGSWTAKLLLFSLQSSEFSVTVKSMTGKSIVVKLDVNDTVEMLKQKIQDTEGIPPEQQRLIYKRNLLNEKFVAEHGVCNGDTIYLVLCLRGGGGEISFVDIENTKLQTKTWSSSAPNWRVCNEGLCLEGNCTNTICGSFNKSRVIMNMEMGIFDFQTDLDRCKCPTCHQQVKPITCAFNNCEWMIVGTKVDSKGARLTYETAWRTAENNYSYFDDMKESKMATYNRLQIHTKTIGSIQRTCSICLESLVSSTTKTNCNHIFHTACLDIKKKRQHSCPMCRSSIN